MMDKRMTAAALEGWSQNLNVAPRERLAAAEQAFKLRGELQVEQEEKLCTLLEYCDGMIRGNESGDAREAYGDVVTQLRAILGVEA